MSAGNSPVGLDFGCRQSDWLFLTCKSLDSYREQVAHVRGLAAKYGRQFEPSEKLANMAERGETFYGTYGEKRKAA